MKKKKVEISDFKLFSISMMSILIFFTLYFFRFLPLRAFNINPTNIDNGILLFYYILSISIALLATIIFVMVYSQKSDDELKVRFKSIGIGIGVICIYFFMPYFQSIPFKILGVDTQNLSTTLKVIYLIAFYVLHAAIIALIYSKKLTKDLKDMQKNNIKYLNKYLKYWLISLFVMMVSNLLINLFVTKDLASNEQTIRDLFDVSPLYVFFSAVIYAPIVEELVFRYSLKKIFSNKWVFIILSGLVFGSLHVFTNFNNLSDLLYIIPYSAPGIAFACMLEDSDNTLVPMSFHFMHNGILISLQFILMIFG